MRLIFCGDGQFQICTVEVGGTVRGILYSVSLVPRPHLAGGEPGNEAIFCRDGQFQISTIEVGVTVWGVLSSFSLIPRLHPAGESRLIFHWDYQLLITLIIPIRNPLLTPFQPFNKSFFGHHR